jgi:acetylornithine deacetylase/succinyl-diaminopimelate desuccinylase-like protein
MDWPDLEAFIADAWEQDVVPMLMEYIAIPAESPAFDSDWETSGHLDRALDLLANWATTRLSEIPGATVEKVYVPGRTSSIFVDIPGDERAPVLFYGHYDKQPAMEGWHDGKGAWLPVLEGDRLYGRGGADDGYSIFSCVTAILALRAQGASHPPVKILIEGSEESGSPDLAATLEILAPRLGRPSLLIALDGSCGDYERLWTMTSLRGQVAGTLTVRTMCEGVHSGEASGVVPAPFRIARQLLTRVENPDTGKIREEFHAAISDEHRAGAEATGEIVGPLHQTMPLSNNTKAVVESASEQLLNRAWRPQLAITGVDGLPRIADAAAVAWPSLSLKVSLRLPPTVNPDTAAATLKQILEADPPYSADVSFTIDMTAAGWSAPSLDPLLRQSIEAASQVAFGSLAASIGGGGGIPFLTMLGELFPGVQFMVTGVLGPESNAHGPNEFLHLPTAKKLTASLALILHDLDLDP